MMELLVTLVIGAIAGWAANMVLKGGSDSLIMNIIVGVIGAFIGGWLFGMLGIAVAGIVARVVSAVVGAILLLFIVGAVKKMM